MSKIQLPVDQAYSVSNKILCPQLLLICICLVIPCRHVAVESCLVLHSPMFSLFIQFKNKNGASQSHTVS